jgi:hypothetical protein
LKKYDLHELRVIFVIVQGVFGYGTNVSDVTGGWQTIWN